MKKKNLEVASQKAIELFGISLLCSMFGDNLAEFLGMKWITWVMLILSLELIRQGFQVLIKGGVIQFTERGIEIHFCDDSCSTKQQ